MPALGRDVSFARISGTYLLTVLGLALAYMLTGKLGLLLATPPGYTTLVWPPSGISVGALLLFGTRAWPGVFLGSFALNAIVGGAGLSLESWMAADLFPAAGIACGSTFQAVVAAALVRRVFGMPLVLKSGRDLATLVLLSGPAACLIASSIGVVTLYLAGTLEPSQLAGSWLTWWTGDLIGVVLLLPLTLVTFGKSGTIIWYDQPVGRLPRRLIPILAVPLVLTFYAWHEISDHLLTRTETRFRALAEENEIALRKRMDAYETGLRGGVGFFAGTDSMTRREWKAYVSALDVEALFPGINGIGFIAAVSDRELPSFLAAVRADDSPDFKVHPQVDGEEHFVITYIEPVSINKEAVGLDIAFEQNRYNAATLARDSGMPAITGRILLVQDATKSPGFLLLQPLYRKWTPTETPAQRREALRGWVYAPFVGRSFMKDLTKAQGHMFNLRVFDGKSADEAALIYENLSPAEYAGHDSRFKVTKQIEVMQKTWTLEWTSTPEFEAETASSEAQLVLGGGLMMTTLFGALIMFFVQRTDTVSQLVALKTKEIAASEETFRSTMEAASVGMILMDPDERILRVNTAACDFLGRGAKQLDGRGFSELTHPEECEEGRSVLEAVKTGRIGSGNWEQRYVHKDGTDVWGLTTVSMSRHADGSPRHLVLQVLDVTERREMDRIKGEFISVVSHELRTPLSSIRGSLGLLLLTLQPDFPEEERELIEIAHKNSERLIRLINDILDIDKIAAGKMRFEFRNADLRELISQAIEANRSYAEEYKVELVEEETQSAHARVDEERLIQVLTNLLSNAAKFSPEGGTVHVSMRRLEDVVQIAVRDEGPGIAPEFSEKIFSRFSQADSSAGRAKGGTGLGLHISKQIVERMGGRIHFETDVGTGTTFFVELPAIDPADGSACPPQAIAQEEQEREPGEPRAGLPRILHIENDVDLSQMLAAALADKAMLSAATSLEEASRLLAGEAFDLVLLEPNMPDGDGLAMLERLRTEGDLNLPIMVLSVDDIGEDLGDAVSAALIKSYSSDKMVVETILRQVA